MQQVVIGIDHAPVLPMDGTLPPDLQGTLARIGPDHGVPGTTGEVEAGDGAGRRGLLHAVELRDGRAVSYEMRESDADETVFWHAGALLALPEHGLPSQYTRHLEPQAFAGGLTVPVASHVHRVAADGSRVLLSAEDLVVRVGEWDARGALRAARVFEVERATWHHDVAVTTGHVAWIDSPTRPLPATRRGPAVAFGWDPGARAGLAIVARDAEDMGVHSIGFDPCLVTHVLGARELSPSADDAAEAHRPVEPRLELYVCCYPVPEPGQPIDPAASVVGPAGTGLSPIGGGGAVLERWTVRGRTLAREQLDERTVEYPRTDPACEGADFRFGYGVETTVGGPADHAVEPVGLLKLDLRQDEVVSWRPRTGGRPSEPLFVRAHDGRADDEGWLLTVVDDPDRGASDLYVLDASTLGRRQPEAVVHLPARLPLGNHGEWVPADRYR